MLKLLRNRWVQLGLCVAVILIVLAAISFFFDVTGAICERGKEAGKPDCGHYNLALFVLIQIYKALDVTSALITAIATALLTGVTYMLVRLGREQAEAASRQIAISGQQADIQLKQQQIERMELIATHRPRLRIRNIVVKNPRPEIMRGSLFVGGDFVSGQLYVSNVGGTDATIIEHLVLVYWSDQGLPMERPYEGQDGYVYQSPVKLQAGQSVPIPFQSRDVIETKDIANMIRNGQHSWQLWVMGWVEYVDDSNIRRRTAFCRRYDPTSRRIVRKEDEDYDHEE